MTTLPNEKYFKSAPPLHPMYQGTRVRLTPLERTYLPKTPEWLNDPEVIGHSTRSEQVSLAEQQISYENFSRMETMKVYAIETVDGEHIGNGMLRHIDFHDRKAELSFFIGEKELWGKGYGTETLSLLLKLAFEGLNLNRVYGKVSVYNKEAQKIIEKIGFRKEGILRQDSFKNGMYIDFFVYSLLADEYFHGKEKSDYVG